MKKFVFSLQKLYDVKVTEEEQKRVELKELDKKMSSLVAHLNDLIDSYNTQKEAFRVASKKGISAFEIKNFGDYFQYLIGEIKLANDRVVACEAEIDVCRQGLLQLMNEKKVLDRMREEQLAEHHAEIDKFNEREIEDFMQGRL